MSGNRNLFRTDRLEDSELGHVQSVLDQLASEKKELPTYREDQISVSKYVIVEEQESGNTYMEKAQLELYDEGFRVIADRAILDEVVGDVTVYRI
jgi:hypothetical protein